MTTRCIITSASNKFFPSLLNLIGSIKNIHPDHPTIYVYDLGLSYSFRRELELMENVRVLTMPHFVPFWRACYTWKTYIFSNPLADLNLYLDAGNQILRPIDSIFSEIDALGYFTVEQNAKLSIITPVEYHDLFPLPQQTYEKNCVTAGIFGFKKDSVVTQSLLELYNAGIAGLCLGFSKEEIWKNKGVNKTAFIRNCRMFRHDTTLLSLILNKNIPDIEPHDVNQYGGSVSPHDHPEQLIWNLRMNYQNLAHLQPSAVHKNPPPVATWNRFVINIFFVLRKINRIIKRT